MRKVFVVIAILLFPLGSFAGDVYLDIAATGCTGGGAANTNYNPATRSCGSGSSKVFAGNYPWQASQSLVNGDHLYIRAGEYWQDYPGYTWSVGALNLTASNLIVENYHGELVWIQNGSDHTNITGTEPNNPISVSGSGSLIKGNNFNFKVWGCLMLSGTNNIVDGLDLSGGWDFMSPVGSDAWYDVVNFDHSVNAILRNSRIHDNYNHGTVTAYANKALIMHGSDENTIVENCEFYNAVAGAVYAKYQPAGGTVHATYRYNFFRNAGGISGPNHYNNKELHVYQNVFLTPGVFYRDGLDTLKFKIYNNTFYNANGTYSCWSGALAWDSFNNIFYANNYAMRTIDLDGAAWASGSHDYNNYYKTGTGSFSWYTNGTDSSLAAFRSRTGQDSHSVETNPGFLNASGLFNTPADFKRSSYPANGRGGSWPNVMGAYITGSEVIGINSGPPPPPPPPPATPQGPSAVPGDSRATVSCNPVSGATAYNIYWSTTSGVTPGTGTKISNVSVPFVHVNLTNGTTYYYVITAVNAGGESGPSAQVSATPVQSISKVPNPPSSLTVN